ncbi:WG repeat-containing protein [Mucilaginibacter rigui]|uniref:WG repeat-containing protein n=1 Tax=Mucilaginibacter rigui TaxID=534635 RepID=A0ABR7X4C0_9SPHI|nr:WG repeat-containing protein [Mucilaginibacter rigui]MBD1385351.1 WG repeat-containing protein [Mucilaginibacter rigui]
MNKKIHSGISYTFGLFFILIAASCSTSSLEDVKTKDEYIKRISALSGDKLQKTLKTDIDSLTSLKEEMDGFTIYIGFGISMSDGSGKKAEVKPDSAFRINTDFAAIKNDINEYSKKLYFIQTPELPNSRFQVAIDEKLGNISTDDIDVKLKKVYTKGRAYPEDKIGMVKADSAAVDFKYEYPKSFETFKFNPQGKKEIAYNKYTIEIDSAGDDNIEFDTPLPLYKDLLSYQALNPAGVLMNSSSNSAMPLTTIKGNIKNDLASALQILKTASKLNNNDAIVKELNKIPSSLFPAIAKYHGFITKYKSLENDKNLKGFDAIKRLKQLMEEDKDLFGLEKQRVTLKFPDKISELILYIGREKETIAQSAVAKITQIASPYQAFADNRVDKYGIVDSNYTIIVPASYGRLDRSDNIGLYYKDYKEKQDFHLDVPNKKLIPIKKGYTYIKDISDHLTMFSDSNKYVGVLENDDKVVIPFEYDDIEKTGNTLLLTKSKRGRKKYEIRTLDNKLVNDLKGLKITPYPDYGMLIIENEKEKLGLIDKDGRTVIQPTYVNLKPIDKDLLLYSEGSDSYQKGIMKVDGTKVTEPKFNYINDFQEGFAVYRTDDINKSYGYLNKAGQPVFGKYTVAYGFAGGYALVFDNNIFSLIDTSGKKVKQIPYKTLGDPTISLTGKSTIYEIDGKKYNYAGQPIN